MDGPLSRKSLETKIVLTLGLVLTAFLGFTAIFDLWYASEGAHGILLKQVEVLANTVQKSLIKDMSSGRGADVQQILETVGTEKGILAVRIFDQDGKILKSADRTEVGQPVSAEVLEGFLSTKRDFVSEEDGYAVLHIVQPIANAPQCYGCHDRSKEINGVLSLDYSLEDTQGYIATHGKWLAAVFLTTVLLAGAVIYVMLKRMVSDPIGSLTSAMSEAEGGNLGVSIPVSSEDEIGRLQDGFNRMLARIRKLLDENLSQQKEIARQEKELEFKQALEDKNSALEAANTEAVEKNRYYMEMLSFISHELKSPLVVLKGYTGMLASGDLGELGRHQMDAVAAMDRNVDALNEMIANYMNLSRLENGSLVPVKRRVDLVEDVVRPVMFEYSGELEKVAMSLRTQCEDPSVTLMADPGLMKSVVGNLVSNAIKYGMPGSDIVVEVSGADDTLRLSVYNEGKGIAKDQLERVFERFTRLGTDETTHHRGSGLGLYLVRLIVEMHGGSVAAESEEGSWARITCTLPAGGKEETDNARVD